MSSVTRLESGGSHPLWNLFIATYVINNVTIYAYANLNGKLGNHRRPLATYRVTKNRSVIKISEQYELLIRLLIYIWRCKCDTPPINLLYTNTIAPDSDLNTIQIENCNIDRASKSYTRTHIKIGSNDCVDIIT